MDPKQRDGRMFLAPGAAASIQNFSFPSSSPSAEAKPVPQSQFPQSQVRADVRVDDHLVRPEVSREEVIRGRKIVTMGANPEHADAHSRIDFLIAPHVCDGCATGSDLLTRVNQGSNFATDVSVRKTGIDPQTGARYLEELSFEVVNEQSERLVMDKAEDLTRRGVRRVFAIFVKERFVGEWSATKCEFIRLSADGMIEDRLLIRPVAVRALLDAAIAESEVALALWKKGNPELRRIVDEEHKKGLDEGHKKGLDEGHKKGLDEGRRILLLSLMRKRFGELPEPIEARIQASSAEELDALSERLFSANSLDEMLAISHPAA